MLYERSIRWLLAGATIVGAVIGAVTAIRLTIVALWFAFLAGAIIVNVLEQKLPDGKSSDFGWFFTGATLCSLLFLWTEVDGI